VNLKQPSLGIVATTLCCVASLAFIALFDFPTFVGWVSYYTMCVVIVQVMMLALWRLEYPRFAAAQAQPLRGILLTLVALIGGAAVCAVSFVLVGGGISPPAPMLVEFTIVGVVMTFLVSIVWGGWPSNIRLKGAMGAGILQLAIGYLINLLLFRTLFNYAFMQGAPVYVASLDPQGLFSAAQLLPLYVTVLAAMFTVMGFDVWPLTKNPRVMQQPALGVVWMLAILAIGGAVFYAGTVIFQMAPMIFLVSVPVAYIFGMIVVLNMCENSLFAGQSQPVKGMLNMVAAIGFGTALSFIYRMLMPSVSGALPSGPPTNAAQLWLASALLAVTFPVLVVYAAFFNFWPLRKVDAVVSKTHPEPS